MSYTLDIPNAPNNPSQDQPLMKANTNAINTLLSVDHVPFNFGTSGYHNVIHQTIQALDPVTISGVNQVYAKNITPVSSVTATDTQLFLKSGLGIISQMSGRLDGADGYVWIGGILIQWGTVVFPIGTVTFKDRVPGAIDFPNNVFEVIVSLTASATASQQATIGTRLVTTTGFTIKAVGGAGAFGPTGWPGFNWLAIGN